MQAIYLNILIITTKDNTTQPVAKLHHPLFISPVSGKMDCYNANPPYT